MAYQTQQLPASPQLLKQLELQHAAWQDPELAALRNLHDAGIAVADMVVVPAAAEERFYRLNNLAQQLMNLFVGVDPADPDEDDIEERAPEAQKLIRSHYVLDEFIDLFYDRLRRLPSQVEVRHPVFSADQAGQRATRGRPALLAIKTLWAQVWSFDNLMNRLAQDASFAPKAQAIVITGAGRQAADAELNARASQILGYDVTLTTLEGAVCSVSHV
jgi:hypothetical protein